MWSELFIKLNKNKEINNYHNSAVIIPMAGEGSRFIKEGYKKIKPLISVSGKEMILQAVNDLPNFEEKIFVLRSDMQGYEEIYKIIEELDIPLDMFEFQVLYGVPMSGWLEKHIAKGYKVRVYVPFGKDWYAYSIRRLKENPDIASYILKDIFRK